MIYFNDALGRIIGNRGYFENKFLGHNDQEDSGFTA